MLFCFENVTNLLIYPIFWSTKCHEINRHLSRPLMASETTFNFRTSYYVVCTKAGHTRNEAIRIKGLFKGQACHLRLWNFNPWLKSSHLNHFCWWFWSRTNKLQVKYLSVLLLQIHSTLCNDCLGELMLRRSRKHCLIWPGYFCFLSFFLVFFSPGNSSLSRMRGETSATRQLGIPEASENLQSLAHSPGFQTCRRIQFKLQLNRRQIGSTQWRKVNSE